MDDIPESISEFSDEEETILPKEELTEQQLKTKETLKKYFQERAKTKAKAQEIPPEKVISQKKQKPPSKAKQSLGSLTPNKMAELIMKEAAKSKIPSLTQKKLQELEQKAPPAKVAKTEKEQRAEVIKANKQIANETAKRLLKDDSLRAPHSTTDLRDVNAKLTTFLRNKPANELLPESVIREYSQYTKYFKEPNRHLTKRKTYKRLYELRHEVEQQIRENDEKDKIARQKRAGQVKASGGAGGAVAF